METSLIKSRIVFDSNFKFKSKKYNNLLSIIVKIVIINYTSLYKYI